MYSIPVYSLRFAAHCRARLRLSEVTIADPVRGSAAAAVARCWIRLAPHPARDHLPGKCESRVPSGSNT